MSDSEDAQDARSAGSTRRLAPLAPTVEAAALVLAIGHEIGNQIGAIRLEAHLLDDDLGPRELAAASVGIDDLAARGSVLLGLLRPLVSSPELFGAARFAPDAVLSGAARMLEDQGLRAVALEVRAECGGVEVPGEHDLLQQLVFALALAGLEAARPKGHLQLVARVEGDAWVVLEVADDGPAEALGAGEALRGRPLLCGLARYLLGRRGGAFETLREGDWTRLALRLPREH